MEENIPAKLPPIKITITPDDFKEISEALKTITEEKKERIGDAIREQALYTLAPTDMDFVSIVAYFAKITSQKRDIDLIKKALDIDQADIAYLIDTAAPPDGILKGITSYTIDADEQPIDGENIVGNPAEQDNATNAVQPDFFPDLTPTIIVNYDEQRIHSDKANVSISKVSQVITKVLNKELQPIIVSPPKAKKTIAVNVTLSLDLPQGTKITRPISFYDRIVEDAIGNLFDQGFTQITPEIVYRQMNGITGTSPVSPEAAGKIDRSIRRLAQTWITMDFTAQLQQKTNDKLKKGLIGDVILPAKNAYLRFSNGTIKSGWLIKELPQIYLYSKSIKQMATIPTVLLQTKDTRRSTPEVIAARYYLILQIERIKHKNTNQKILFDSLFTTIDDSKALTNREVRRRRIIAITKILDKFKQVQYITGYKIEKARGGKVAGVTVEISPPTETIEESKHS